MQKSFLSGNPHPNFASFTGPTTSGKALNKDHEKPSEEMLLNTSTLLQHLRPETARTKKDTRQVRVSFNSKKIDCLGNTRGALPPTDCRKSGLRLDLSENCRPSAFFIPCFD